MNNLLIYGANNDFSLIIFKKKAELLENNSAYQKLNV